MNWEMILNKLRDPKVLSYFSLIGLPVRPNSVGNSYELNLLAYPFASSVLSHNNINDEHLSYLDSIGLAPQFVENQYPFKGQYTQSFFLNPSIEKQQLGNKWCIQPALYDYPSKKFHMMMDRNFLLNNPKHNIPIIPSYSLFGREHEYQRLDRGRLDQLFADICRFLDIDKSQNFFNKSKILYRHTQSIQGHCAQILNDSRDLYEVLKFESIRQGLFTKIYSMDEIVENIGLTIGMSDTKATLLGVTQQNSCEFRHYGSKSKKINYEIQKILDNVISELNTLLVSEGVKSGVFGIEGFLLNTPNSQKINFLAYDFNPCMSQGFFTLLFKELILRKFGIQAEVSISLMSIFAKPNENTSFEWINPKNVNSGIFPLLIIDHLNVRLSYKRIVVMVAAISPFNPDDELKKWKENILTKNESKVLKIMDMYF